MSWAGAGAGAAEGLDAFLEQELARQKFAQSQKEHTDEVGLKTRQLDQSSRQIDQTGDNFKSEAALRAEQTQAIIDKRNQDAQRGDFENEILNDPTATDQVKSYLKLRRATEKGESVPYQIITEPNGPPRATPPAGPVEDTPGGLVRVGPDNKSTPLMGEDGKPLTRYHAPVAPGLAQSDAGFFLVPRTGPNAGNATPVKTGDGDQLPIKSPSSVATQAASRTTGLAAVDRLTSDIDEADAAGLLGPASGRLYNAFAKAGTTGDKTKDKLIGRIKGDLLLTKMHVDSGIGGTRAASSPLLLQQWEDMAMKSSPDILKGYLSGIRDDMSPHGSAAASSTAEAPKERTYNPATGKLE